MNDLARWLLDQIDEDENEARRAIERTTTSRRMIRGEMVAVKIEPPRWRTAAWPPERVLAECEAKRRLIRWVLDWPMRPAKPSSVDGVLEMLTPPYVDRHGYREEWAP